MFGNIHINYCNNWFVFNNLPFVEALGMRGSVIFGDNDVSGWTIGITAIF